MMPDVPSSIVMVTVEPGATLVPAAGVWSITCPGSPQSAVCSMRAPSPTAASWLTAWPVASPTRSGTVIDTGSFTRSSARPVVVEQRGTLAGALRHQAVCTTLGAAPPPVHHDIAANPRVRRLCRSGGSLVEEPGDDGV